MWEHHEKIRRGRDDTMHVRGEEKYVQSVGGET
jgi:hypothetical protein